MSLPSGCGSSDFIRWSNARVFQIDSQLPGGGFEGRVPFQIETFDAAQNAVGIFFGGDVAKRKTVGCKQIGRCNLGGKGGHDVAGAAHFAARKKSSDSIMLPSAIWTGVRGRGATHRTTRRRRWLLRLARIVLQRPCHKRDVANKVRKAVSQQSVTDGSDAGIFNRNKGEVGRKPARKNSKPPSHASRKSSIPTARKNQIEATGRCR